MSSTTSSNRAVTWVALLVGVVVLGLLVVFAVVLPKATGDSGEGAPLNLPDTLPGGYTAADLPEAFTGQYADRGKEISAQQQKTREYGDRVMSDVLGEPAATRAYASKDMRTAVFVQAFRASGGAFAPDSLADPSLQPGSSAPQMMRVGDAACIVTPAASQPGQPSDPTAPPTYAQCQVSEGDLTVQVGSQGVATRTIVDLADHVFADLQDQ